MADMQTATAAKGKIVQCIGAVVDVEFPRDAMPKVYDALDWYVRYCLPCGSSNQRVSSTVSASTSNARVVEPAPFRRNVPGEVCS